MMTMANNPISRVIVDATPNLEGPSSGMNGGSSDSIIGVATDEVNPTLSSFPRIPVGARTSPIGLPAGILGAGQYYVDYPNDSFDRSPVVFAEAENDAAVGEVYATDVNGSGLDVTNESSDAIETGDWLWGVAAPAPDLELIIDGTFEEGMTHWTNPTGYANSVTNNQLTIDRNFNSGVRDTFNIDSAFLAAPALYKLTFDLISTTTVFDMTIGSGRVDPVTQWDSGDIGTITYTFSPRLAGRFGLRPLSLDNPTDTIVVANVSCKEVIQ
jgi:hypothetical protein